MFVVCTGVVFFFKQKTAYEMRISDWSSDVCSSDLSRHTPRSARRGGLSLVAMSLPYMPHLPCASLPFSAGEGGLSLPIVAGQTGEGRREAFPPRTLERRNNQQMLFL